MPEDPEIPSWGYQPGHLPLGYPPWSPWLRRRREARALRAQPAQEPGLRPAPWTPARWRLRHSLPPRLLRRSGSRPPGPPRPPRPPLSWLLATARRLDLAEHRLGLYLLRVLRLDRADLEVPLRVLVLGLLVLVLVLAVSLVLLQPAFWASAPRT